MLIVLFMGSLSWDYTVCSFMSKNRGKQWQRKVFVDIFFKKRNGLIHNTLELPWWSDLKGTHNI